MIKRLRFITLLVLSFVFSYLGAQDGTVVWEKFKPFSGTLVDVSVAENPVETQVLSSIDAPMNIDDGYAARITGYIVPSETGIYTFYIASDDESEFWLSTDILPQNKSLKCFVSSWATHTEWNKEAANQESDPVSLMAGRFYYFEALHIEGGGGDHLEVGWKTPSNGTITIIGSEFISSEAVVDSSLTDIEVFEFPGLGVPAEGDIDTDLNTISVEVPFGTDVTNLAPDVKASFGASVSPLSGIGQDFTNPVDYTVTSANGSNTEVYTVTVTVAAARNDNLVESIKLNYGFIEINGVIDNDANTISFELYEGLSDTAILEFDKDYFAVPTIASGTEVVVSELSTLSLTAQNTDVRNYSISVTTLPSAVGFSDDFATDSYMSGWVDMNWNNSGTGSNYTISHDPSAEELQLTKSTAINDYIVFNFPEELNFGIVEPLVRFRVKSASPISKFDAKLQDAYAPSPDGNFSIASGWNTIPVPADGSYHEAIWDYTGKFNSVNPFRITNLVMGVDRTVNVALSDVRIDDFRAGVDAYANVKPYADPIENPKYAYITDGVQTIQITGIDDGNPERDETIVITAVSSNQDVVADGDITVSYDGTSSTATVSYTPSSNGATVITVSLKDDRGTVYSDEEDTGTLTFIAQFRDSTPGVNDVATFGMPEFTHINVGAGHQHIVVISKVDDGDEDEDQKVFFDAVNNSTDMITIDSISYVPGNHFAILYFKDNGLTGNASVTVSCIDEIDQDLGKEPFELTFDIELGTYHTFGGYYGATQIQQWQPQPYKTDPVFKEGYPILIDEATVNDPCKDDFFWGKMWGYIIAPVDGVYKFYSNTEGEGIGNFYLSSNESADGLPAEDNPTAKTGQASVFIELEAGKAYYFEAFHKEIVNSYFLTLEWVYPGISTKEVIKKPFLFNLIDMELPEASTGVELIKKGSNQALVKWTESNDNLGVLGYYVYVNGERYNDVLLKDLSCTIEGLDPETGYDIFVMSVDKLYNYSKPSGVLSFETYGLDENPPSAPANLGSDLHTALTVSLTWDEATDAETEVYGYNVYIDGSSEPVNDELIIGTSYKVDGLDITTGYSFVVTALDAALNESLPSNSISVTTNDFDWTDKNEEAHIGLVTVTLNPTVPATGFALEGDFHLGSMFLSNKISYNSFEDDHFKDFASTEDLSAVGKSKTSGLVYYAETEDVYHGDKAAKLEVGPGESFTVNSSIIMNPGFDYLLRIPAKKDAMYNGAVGIRVYRDVGGTVVAYNGSFTPTDTWTVYEIEFPGIQDASRSWKIELNFNSLGYVYLDDIQFHLKHWYNPDSKFSKVGLQVLDELNPAGIRWGAIDANYESFSESVGPYQKNGLTFGDFAELSARYGGYVMLTTGVNSATDWVADQNTFSHFIDYLNGAAGNEWADLRIAEGYTEAFDTRLKGIIVEMGNEVWGFDAHGADVFSDSYINYTQWAADIAKNNIKSNANYNPENMWVSFSGRSPDNNYGLHDALFGFEDSQMDMLSISGYLGGNLAYDPAIDPGDSQLDYHKNSYYSYYRKMVGLKSIFRTMLEQIGRIVPMYMYEGNLTTNEYHGTIGQAVTFADYYAEALETGVALPDVFNIEGGQWRMIDNLIDLSKRPLYYMVQYYNAFRGGVVLEHEYNSMDSIYNDNGSEIKLESVGVHTFANGENYGVVLYSRDFENDYLIQLDLPDDIGSISNGKMIVVSAEKFNSLQATVEETDITVEDKMLVSIPKHSAVYISFTADDKNLQPAGEIGHFEYQRVEDLILSTAEGTTEITEPTGKLKIVWTTIPEDAFYAAVDLEIIENTCNATLSSTGYVRSDKITNGYITIRGRTKDHSNLTDEITITVSGQNVGVEDNLADGFSLYPNPANDILNISTPGNANGRLSVCNVQGKVLIQTEIVSEIQEIKISELPKGIYFVKIENEKDFRVLRFVKE